MYKLYMKKISTFLMISFMSISMSYASEKIILEDYINSFAWEKRIVLFISKSKYVYFINETDNFFKKNKHKALEKYFDKDKKILSKFSLRGLPTTFIANKDYKVFAKVEGIIEWDSKSFISWLNKN